MTAEPRAHSDTETLLSERRALIASHHLEDEEAVGGRLLAAAELGADQKEATTGLARRLVEAVRNGRRPAGGVDAFLREYQLSSEEGVLLMCLAESLLRIPDGATADQLIGDKIGHGNWGSHLGRSPSFLVNASTFGLLLTGRVVRLERTTKRDPSAAVGRLFAKGGEPVIRRAVLHAVRILARQFVLGRTIKEALARADQIAEEGYRFSFDMLGESARTAADAERYTKAHLQAIEAITAHINSETSHLTGAVEGDIFTAPSVSIKLSALHPRFHFTQHKRILTELVPRLVTLCEKAADGGLGVTIDAEESDRLDLTLDIFEATLRTHSLSGWHGLGIAVQAYQKRALPVLDWLEVLARLTKRRIPVRLVKGAYWDTEIKHAQERGLDDYPVFTRKAATDSSFLACAKALLKAPDRFCPQFATHNAHTLAAVIALAGKDTRPEFQRLYGMGEPLYQAVMGPERLGVDCRIYAPVGGHEELLSYLVRRLLENGANTSFVNRLADDAAPLEAIIADPVETLSRATLKAHPQIPRPIEIFSPERQAAHGYALDNNVTAQLLCDEIESGLAEHTVSAPVISGVARPGESRPVTDPADHSRIVGRVVEASGRDIDAALTAAVAAAPDWNARGGGERARILDRAADLFETRAAALMALCVREAGKTIPNAIGDVREAVDFLHYYAARAKAGFEKPLELPGPTGERNALSLNGRGVFACISPWNFPLAIFTGQVAAALAAGNAVIAKPAEQTPLVAFKAVSLLHEAGVPADVLHLLPGDGKAVGGALVRDVRIAGVAFTGSLETARAINRALAERPGPIVPLIAETGGLNAMIADSSALIEQVVDDAILGAFDSAGQRCSATRILFVQEPIANKVITMLKGAIAELRVGDPIRLETDIGPIIDRPSCDKLEAHAARMAHEGTLLALAPVTAETENGTFFAPRAFALESASALKAEVFGPILHIVRFANHQLMSVCDWINASGFGLTLGLHTRVDATVETLRRAVRVGNLYVNRSQIGAVVGAQPFGGEGLSGTGLKAGGPHYLHRFMTERTVSIDTTAAGGNASLLMLD